MGLKNKEITIAKGVNVVYQRYCENEQCRIAMNEIIGSLIETLKIKGNFNQEEFLIYATRKQLSIFPAQTELLKKKMPLGGK